MANENLTRTQLHEKAMICIYQQLFYTSLVDSKYRKNIEEIVLDVMDIPFSSCDEYFKTIVFETLKEKNELKDIINDNLAKTWTFDRLNLIEQAILLLFSLEILNRRSEKQVAIDTAVDLTKKYCDEKSYKFVNAVLDKIGKNYEY